MDDRPEGGADLPDGPGEEAIEPVVPPVPSDADEPSVVGLPADSAAGRELADEAAEIRRMVDAGAGSPEAIRELAARLREHRAREEALWRTQVKPGLVRDGRGRLRGHGKPGRDDERSPAASNAMSLGLLILGLVFVVVVAANTSVWLLVLPVLGLLAYAWTQGRDSTGT